jgi:thioredoxin 1
MQLTIESVIKHYETSNDVELTVNKIDVDENVTESLSWEITNVPTLIFIVEGNEVKRISGAKPKSEIINVINSLVNTQA